MNTLELLRQQNKELAELLEAAGKDQLHRISSVLAHSVVDCSALSHPLITEALRHLDASPRSNSELRERVQKLVEQLDVDYSRLQELSEEGKATKQQVQAAFSKARAAAAVASALGDVAFTAVVETAYEANAANGDSILLAEIAKAALTK